MTDVDPLVTEFFDTSVRDLFGPKRELLDRIALAADAGNRSAQILLNAMPPREDWDKWANNNMW